MYSLHSINPYKNGFLSVVMEVKVKKQNSDGIVRLETSGEFKEILLNEDFMKPKDAKISLCFRGRNSSGIVDFSIEEAEEISEEIIKRLEVVKGAKVLRFKK